MARAVFDAAQLEQQRAWIRDQLNYGARPEPDLLVSEWADKYRILPPTSPEPGPYRSSRTPYMVEIMDTLHHAHPAREVYFMKGGQIAATTGGENWIGHIMDNAPGPAMAIEPGETLLKRLVNHRINPMIKSVPTLRAKISDKKQGVGRDNAAEKSFPGGFLIMATANSSAHLRQSSIRYILADEIDEWPPDVAGQGDPYILAKRRTATYENSYKIFVPSTPTSRALSRIHKLFKKGDQRYYELPCPHCGTYQRLTWKHIKWTTTKKGVHKYNTVYMRCEACENKIPEAKYKTWMLEHGRWTTTAVAEDPALVSFHLSSLYSPVGWYSWERAAREFIEAKRDGHNAMKAWQNTVLGEVSDEEGEGLDAESLLAHRVPYPAQVPEGGYLLTAGVDVQLTRLELEVVAWDENLTSWSVDYRVIPGSPKEPETWAELEAVLSHEWMHESGVPLRIAGMMIDSNYASEKVWKFARKHETRNVHCGVGKDGNWRPAVSAPMRRKPGKDVRPVQVFTMGVDGLKAEVYNHLERKLTEPGACFFPTRVPPYDLTYFRMLTAEKRKLSHHKGYPVYIWRPIEGRRNEALDARVYALAALYLLNPLWPTVKKRFLKRVDTLRLAGQVGEEAEPKKPRKRTRSKKLVKVR